MSCRVDRYLESLDLQLAMLKSGNRFDDSRHTQLARAMADERAGMDDEEQLLVASEIEKRKVSP